MTYIHLVPNAPFWDLMGTFPAPSVEGNGSIHPLISQMCECQEQEAP